MGASIESIRSDLENRLTHEIECSKREIEEQRATDENLKEEAERGSESTREPTQISKERNRSL